MFSLIIKNDRKSWYSFGVRHRINGPALIFSGLTDMCKDFWFENGQQYIFQKNGTREFIDIFGRLCRDDDLPAIEYINGDKEWWFLGVRHRLNSPAVIYGNKQYWFEYGEFIKCTF